MATEPGVSFESLKIRKPNIARPISRTKIKQPKTIVVTQKLYKFFFSSVKDESSIA